MTNNLLNAEITSLAGEIQKMFAYDISNQDYASALRNLSSNLSVFHACSSSLLDILALLPENNSCSNVRRLKYLILDHTPDGSKRMAWSLLFRDSLEKSDYELVKLMMPTNGIKLVYPGFEINYITCSFLNIVFEDIRNQGQAFDLLCKFVAYEQKWLETRLLRVLGLSVLQIDPVFSDETIGRSLVERDCVTNLLQVIDAIKTADFNRSYNHLNLLFHSHSKAPSVYKKLWSNLLGQIPAYAEAFKIVVHSTNVSSSIDNAADIVVPGSCGSSLDTASIMNILSRVYYCESASLLFIEVPKVASSSILAAISLANGDRPYWDSVTDFDTWLSNLRTESKWVMKLSELPLEKAWELLHDASIKQFAFARDPVRRFISSYHDKFVLGSLRDFHPWPTIYRYSHCGEWNPLPQYAYSIIDFARGFIRLPKECQEIHFRSQNLLLGSGSFSRLSVYRFDDRHSLDAIFETICPPQYIDKIRTLRPRQPHSTPRLISDSYYSLLSSSGLIDSIKDYYADDYILISGATSIQGVKPI